jgi:hypothetical protein
MKILNITWLIIAMTIIALGGIAVTAGALSSLVQLVGATDVTTTTIGGQGVGEEGAPTDSTTTTNNISNTVLGDLFMIVEFKTANVNPINETYIEISTVNNVTIMPPNATATTTINATETANTTVNILPNGLAVDKGQSVITTEGDDGSAEEQENATTTFVDISRMNPDGSGSGTGVVFFSTNSTGQLAFLDNMVGISQSEFSPEGGSIRTWEWKGGGTVPFVNEGDDGTTTNTPEEPSLMNTTMTDGTTTAADTNATEASAAPEEEGEGNEEGEDPNEFEDCVVPPGRDPGDVGC